MAHMRPAARAPMVIASYNFHRARLVTSGMAGGWRGCCSRAGVCSSRWLFAKQTVQKREARSEKRECQRQQASLKRGSDFAKQTGRTLLLRIAIFAKQTLVAWPGALLCGPAPCVTP